MFKKAKSRPSLRARDSEDVATTSSPLGRSSFAADDPDTTIDVDGEEDGDVSMGSVFERKKAGKRDKDKRQGRPIGGSRLSFGGDKTGGEGEPSKPRRSLLSQSTTARLENAVASSSSSPLGASPSYSSDYLSQLKASTPTRGPRPVTVEDDGIEEVDANGLSKMAREKYASVDTTEGIPDTAAIAAAKMKRQARVEISKHDAGNEEDFISLGGGKLIVHDGEDRGPHPESRLMREEDEGDEGDEGDYLLLLLWHSLIIDMAMYTEANDKLHIGKKAKGDAARRLRNEIGELIDDRFVLTPDCEMTADV
jgi:GC-rich sequence DNA-binding factor